jgi:hypothetical protein
MIRGSIVGHFGAATQTTPTIRPYLRFGVSAVAAWVSVATRWRRCTHRGRWRGRLLRSSHSRRSCSARPRPRLRRTATMLRLRFVCGICRAWRQSARLARDGGGRRVGSANGMGDDELDQRAQRRPAVSPRRRRPLAAHGRGVVGPHPRPHPVSFSTLAPTSSRPAPAMPRAASSRCPHPPRPRGRFQDHWFEKPLA